MLHFYAGDMQLCVKSDATYLVLPKARSWIAGHFYLNAYKAPNKAYSTNFNVPILTECVTIKTVVSSVDEAETAGLFHNCITAIAIYNGLVGLGHLQNKTSVKTDNSTANSFVQSEMCVKHSKSWDMKYNWLRNCVAQDRFNIKWDKGAHNLVDYFTKHLPLATTKLLDPLMFFKRLSGDLSYPNLSTVTYVRAKVCWSTLFYSYGINLHNYIRKYITVTKIP